MSRRIPPPPIGSSSLRNESPMITVDEASQDPFTDEERIRQSSGIRTLTPNLTPVSTAPNSPILRAHERPFYQSHASFSSEMLLAPNIRRQTQQGKTDSVGSNFINEYYGRPRSDYDPWGNTSSGRSTPENAFASRPTSQEPFNWNLDSRDGDSRPVTRSSNHGGDDSYNMHQIAEKFTIYPQDDLLIYPGDVEPDDWMHNPDPDEKRVYRDGNIMTRRGVVNLGGLGLIAAGLICMFIVLPVLFYTTTITTHKEVEPPCSGYQCLDDAVSKPPLLKNARVGLIDPETPQSARTKTAADGSTYKLVFSDEFNTEERSFYGGDDPFWEAVDIHYAATGDMEWYDPDAITTKGGVLEITFDNFQNHDLNFRSGMLQSWNKLCFKGGIIEASISLPGRGDVSGLWPGFWTMGNLGRPGYTGSTEGMWPYSYWDKCDAGITANQSSPDGISYLPGMKLPGCPCSGEDHPTPGTARSSPEIDIFEQSSAFIDAAQQERVGLVSQSGQFAPFDVWYQPDYDHVMVYNTSLTTINSYRGGNFQQTMSGVTMLNNDWFDGNAYQVYGMEYEPGANGMIEWEIGDTKVWRMNGAAVGPNGNIGQRLIPVEPMSIIFNVGMGTSFAFVDFVALSKLYPAKMRVDWIRIYQPNGGESVTCDPPGYETTDYIARHPVAYQNPNVTNWAATNYTWPKNTYVDGCSA